MNSPEGAAALKRAIAKTAPADRYMARQYVKELESDVEDVSKALTAYFEIGYEVGVAAGAKLSDEDA